MKELPYLLLLLLRSCSGFVIAPSWVNLSRNPCSSSSWQLIFWPQTQQCYKIFSQGPCPDTQELSFDEEDQAPVCRCPQNLPLHWKPTDRCYSRYNRGPCQVNQYLEFEEKTGKPECRTSERCEPGQIFWPPDRTCHQLYTQGPCHKGDLLIVNPLTTEPYCGCDSVLLKQYYYPPLKLCYEQMTLGPCETGLLFMYNHTADTTQCSCSENLNNFSPTFGQCFELGSKGPCGDGQIFENNSVLKKSRCECKDKYVYWEKTDACFREFTPGPCRGNQFIIKGRDGKGVCSKNPCSSTDLFFPSEPDNSKGECHKVGNRGSCPDGELVIFETYSGKSYRGNCGCSSGYNQNYWPEDGKCYEWYSQGPCKESFFFKYNRDTRSTECICDASAGLVFWNETQGCYLPYTQGPCPENSWLIPGGETEEVYCECRDGFQFSLEDYTCNPVVRVSGHRFESLWSNVAEYVERRRKESEPLPRKPEEDKSTRRRMRETGRRRRIT